MGLQSNIVVVDYSPLWPQQFAEEAEALQQALPGVFAAIHHIGSTSVPGLAAKPLIDILPEVHSLEELDAHNAQMQALGYTPKGAFGIAGRRFFSKGADDARTHHIHAFEVGHWEVAKHVDFRDYLRAHPEEARRYGALKQQLAQQHPNDIEAYIDGKDPLIQELSEQTRLWLDRRAAQQDTA